MIVITKQNRKKLLRLKKKQYVFIRLPTDDGREHNAASRDVGSACTLFSLFILLNK